MVLPAARGGDGISRGRIALWHSGVIRWDQVHPAPKDDLQRNGTWELRNGLDWSEPQIEPSTSNDALCWTSHAFAKGMIKLSELTPPTYVSKEGDLQINNIIHLLFWPQWNYMAVNVRMQTRDLSQPLEEPAATPDGDQLPPYST